MRAKPVAHRYRTVFISDVHLGTRGCQAELLLEFIRELECETIYLVGDIVDGWKMKSGWFWPQAHNDVVQKLLRMARKGVRVVYVPGNHDDRVRDFCGVHFGGVIVARDAVHEAADGRRYLVLHGDEFDGVARHARWVAFLGDWAYRALIGLNTHLNRARRRMGFGYWSLSAWIKGKMRNAQAYIAAYEVAAAGEARRRGLDGVICGHIHQAAEREIEGVLYLNDGDWVESCTAVVEHADGRMELLRLAEAAPDRSVSPFRVDPAAQEAFRSEARLEGERSTPKPAPEAALTRVFAP